MFGGDYKERHGKIWKDRACPPLSWRALESSVFSFGLFSMVGVILILFCVWLPHMSPWCTLRACSGAWGAYVVFALVSVGGVGSGRGQSLGSSSVRESRSRCIHHYKTGTFCTFYYIITL